MFKMKRFNELYRKILLENKLVTSSSDLLSQNMKSTGDKKMKLSSAQIQVLKEAQEMINIAKENDYPEWLMLVSSPTDWREESFAHWKDREAAQRVIEKNKAKWEECINRNYLKNVWEDARNNIAVVHTSSRSLYALEKLGYIKIISDTNGQQFGVDKIKLLKFDF